MFHNLAALATHGGTFSHLFVKREILGTEHYPLVYGQDVWVDKPPVISCRILPNGSYERVQILSIGQMTPGATGDLGAIDNQIYNDAYAFIGTATTTTNGTTAQAQLPITELFLPRNCTGSNSPVTQSYGPINNLPGLAAVLSTTATKDIPSFRVQQGRSLLQLNSVGTVSFGKPLVTYSINSVNVGDVVFCLSNNTTGTISSINQDGTFNTTNQLEEGSTFVTGINGYTATLPDVLFDLLTVDFGGIRSLGLSPSFSLDFETLIQAKKYCVENAYYFSGVIHDTAIQRFIAIAAPQSGLIPFRKNNQLGFQTKIPPKPSFLFNSSNATAFTLLCHNWDEHQTTRLICKHNLGLPDSTFVTEDGIAEDGLTEESLDWLYVANTEQLEQNAIDYLKSIRNQHTSITFFAINPSFPLRAGETIEVQHPRTQTKDQISGYVVQRSEPEAGISGQRQIIELSSQPVIAYGTSHPTSTFSELVDLSADFTMLVEVDDVLVMGKTAFIISGVQKNKLTLATQGIPLNTPYQVLDMTIPNATASIWDNQIGGYESNVTVTPKLNVLTNQIPKVVYEMTGHKNAIAVRSAINIGTIHNLYRVATVEPDAGRKNYRVTATAI